MLKTKFLLPLILILLTFIIMGHCATYTTQYPPSHNSTYVKATTHYESDPNFMYPYYATDPGTSLTGVGISNNWSSEDPENIEQRFHIDLGSAKIIRRIYYENGHHNGTYTTRGAQNFTFWGSDIGSGSFDDLVWGNDDGWTELTVAQNTFDEHIGADQADPKYIVVTNTMSYRYYAFKFADNRTDENYIQVRRIELQMEDGYPPSVMNVMFMFSNF